MRNELMIWWESGKVECCHPVVSPCIVCIVWHCWLLLADCLLWRQGLSSGGGEWSSPVRHQNTRPQSSAAPTVMTAGNTPSQSSGPATLLQQTDLHQQHCGLWAPTSPLLSSPPPPTPKSLPALLTAHFSLSDLIFSTIRLADYYECSGQWRRVSVVVVNWLFNDFNINEADCHYSDIISQGNGSVGTPLTDWEIKFQ